MTGSVHRASARLLLGGACLALIACGGGAATDPERPSLLDELRAHPGRLPPAPPEGTGVVLLNVKLHGGRIEPGGGILPVGGTLGFQRGLARRRTSPPEYWALQTEAGSETVRYWTPFDPTPGVRVSLPAEGAERSEASVQIPDTLVPLKLPFFPGGTVTFRTADGTLAGELLFGPTSAARDRCPQVHRIHGTAPVDRALNVVVLPAGFTKEELDDFRCGAGLMIERFLSFEPYTGYSESINVFRIDLAAKESGVRGAECPDPSRHEGVDWAGKEEECRAYEQNHPAQSTLLAGPTTAPEWRLGLDVRTCPASVPSSNVLWPSDEGEHVLWRLAACAPAFDVVLVLANSEEYAGGGIETETHCLAVTTFCGIDTMPTRSEILAHEFGHALGLLDEYGYATYPDGTKAPDFLEGRNVVRAAADGTIGNVPWAASCRNRPNDPPSPCQVICARGCGSCEGDPDGGGPHVGLYEGGFYNPCGYYRSMQGCRMNSLSGDDFYCEACTLHLRSLFEEDLGLRRSGPGT